MDTTPHSPDVRKIRRRVAPSLVLAIVFRSATAQMKWFAFGFFMVFLWASAVWTWWTIPLYWFGTVTTNGKIIRIHNTDVEVNDVRLVECTCEYTTPDGIKHTTVYRARGGNYRLGDSVAIECSRVSKGISRMKGVPGECPASAGIIVTLLVGLLLRGIVGGIRDDARTIRLLRMGKEARGTLVAKECRGGGQGEEAYNLTLAFKANGSSRESTTKVHMAAAPEKGTRLSLLYDPAHPDRIAVPEAMMHRVHVYGTEEVASRDVSMIGTLPYLIIPFAVIIGHGLYAYFRFIR